MQSSKLLQIDTSVESIIQTIKEAIANGDLPECKDYSDEQIYELAHASQCLIEINAEQAENFAKEQLRKSMKSKETASITTKTAQPF